MQRFNDSSRVAACLNYNFNQTEPNQSNRVLAVTKKKFLQPELDAPRRKNMKGVSDEKKFTYTKAPVRTSSIIKNDNRCKCTSCLAKTLAQTQTIQTSPRSKMANNNPNKVTSNNSLTQFMQNIRNEKPFSKAKTIYANNNLNKVTSNNSLTQFMQNIRNEKPFSKAKTIYANNIDNDQVNFKKTRPLSNDFNDFKSPTKPTVVRKSKPKTQQTDQIIATTEINKSQIDNCGLIINAFDAAKNQNNRQTFNQNFSSYSLNTSSLFSYRNDPAYIEMLRNSRKNTRGKIESKPVFNPISGKKKPAAISIKSNKSCQTNDDFESSPVVKKFNAFIVSNVQGGLSGNRKLATHTNVCNHIDVVCENCARNLLDKYGRDLKIFSPYIT
jgi:hypothetical protein